MISETDIERANAVPIREIWERLGFQPPKNGENVKSPFREDTNASLQIGGRKNIVFDHGTGQTFDCIALTRETKNCNFREAIEWILGIALSQSSTNNGHKPEDKEGPAPVVGEGGVTNIYTYEDAIGKPVFSIVRKHGKKFSVCVPHPTKDGWVLWKGPARKCLYRGRRIAQAIKARQPIYLVEGERDVHTLELFGLVATTSPHGAKSWKPFYAETLADAAEITILPDNDEEGRGYAKTAALSICGKVGLIRIVQLPGLPDKGDITDWVAAGGTLEALLDIVKSTPHWTPSEEQEIEDDPLDRILDLPETIEKNDTLEFHDTDLGNAELFASEQGRNMRFCHRWNEWLFWQGDRWKRDDSGEVYRRAGDTIRDLYLKATRETDPKLRARMAKHAARCESARRLKDMVFLAQSRDGIPVSPSDLDKANLFNCANGTYDLDTGEFRKHRQEDMLTKISPVHFNPDADCPLFMEFLDVVMDGNRDLISFLQRLAGYCLTANVSEQILVFLYGSGANGKTTFTNALLNVWGDYGRQVDPDLLLLKRGETHPTGIADLHGVRYAVSQEVEEGKHLAEALVKQLTGGDRITARRMRQDFFEFDPTHKIFLAANHRPTITGTDHAIWRRIRLIPFTVTIVDEDQDKNLPEKLKTEASGILAWAIRGYQDWKRIGLAEPEEVLVATADYRSEMDTIGEFIQERCTEIEVASVKSSALRKDYEDWCRDNGEIPAGSTTFRNRLIERGHRSRRGTGGTRFWDGIGLKAEGE